MHFNFNKEEEKKFLSLLDQHENNLDYLIYLRDLLWQNNIKDISLFNNKNTFEKRTIFVDELFKNKPVDNSFIKKALRWDVNIIDIREYIHNPYLKAINNLAFNEGDWSLSIKKMKAYSLFPYEEEYHYGGDAILKMNLGFFDQDYSYPTLSLCDNEWMSLNPFEIRTMQVPIELARGKVLTLGLGLGYFAYMVHLKEEVKEVHIVEMDLELIKLFNKYLLPLFPFKEKIHIHKADAFYSIKDIKDHDYDFIFSDLWHDVGDGLTSYISLKKAFNSFKYTQRHYWIEGSLISYLRLLVIGVIKDQYTGTKNEYDPLQSQIENSLRDIKLKSSYDIDKLLSIKGLLDLVL